MGLDYTQLEKIKQFMKASKNRINKSAVELFERIA
jgi:hypothetical protein